MACEKGSVEVVDKLLEMKTDVHHVDKVSASLIRLTADESHSSTMLLQLTSV